MTCVIPIMVQQAKVRSMQAQVQTKTECKIFKCPSQTTPKICCNETSVKYKLKERRPASKRNGDRDDVGIGALSL